MKVGVVILNYNSAEDCKKCINDLLMQQGVDLDIVVVDNCSQAADREAVEDLCRKHGLTFIGAEKNRGYNAGNNIGLRYCAGQGYEYALIANPDMQFPEHDYIAKLVGVMQSDPDIAAVGSDILTPEGIHQNPMSRDGNWTTSFNWIVSLLKRKKADTYDFIDDYAHSHYCSKVSGCCLMVRLSTMKDLGYFDEGVFLYCEEAILSRQIEQVNKKMYYTADTYALHAHVKKAKGNPVNGFKRWRKSRMYYIDKYSGDAWLCRQIAKLSMNVYTAITITALKLKSHFKSLFLL